jgi:hypothetical protein
MNTRPRLQRLTWETIVLAIGGAVFVAWAVGFLAGLVMHFGFGV